MPSFRTGRVTAVLADRPGLQRVDTDVGRAYVLTQLTGDVAVGDEVVVNTTAVALGLGTGGWHVVHWNLSRRDWAEMGPGHIMKLRYTSLQVDAGAAEEQHPDLPTDLGGMPVVVGSLHSQLAPVVVALRHARPAARVSYVMTDGAALPIALSDLVHAMRAGGHLTGTITARHAFGGELEAVSIASALTLARHVQRAHVAVVAMGPGVVGTGSTLGTTATEVAGILDTAAALGGQPVAALRMSDGDARARHQGVSHHSETALRLTRSRVIVAAPAGAEIAEEPRHDVRRVPPIDIAGLLVGAGLRVTTMGRGPAEDPAFFAAAAAAGTVAASLL
jgi:hypothetical protein